MDLLSPDDIKSIFGSPFVSQFWPSIVGGLVIFVAMVRGARWMMFMVLLVTAFVQAWHMGLFSNAT